MQRQIVGFAVVLLTVFIPAAAQVDGSGTSHNIPVWTDSNTLGNSILFQSNGMVGVGTTTPTARMSIVGQDGQFGSPAPFALRVIGGRGGTDASTSYAGGPIQLVGGQGAGSCICNAPGGAGGTAWFTGGAGGHGFVNGGIGGWLQIASGTGGGITSGATGGLGALIVLAPGRGAMWGSGVSHGGNGGSITLQPGAGGVGTASSGTTGNVVLVPRGGNVGIGITNPDNTFEVAAGGTTLADHWVTRSSRRLKTNIQPLVGALEKVSLLQGVSYERKADGKHEIGVVAEDVARVVPEVVSRDPNTHEVQGVEYSRLSALLIEAIKAQEAEIQQLRSRIERISADSSRQ